MLYCTLKIMVSLYDNHIIVQQIISQEIYPTDNAINTKLPTHKQKKNHKQRN
jgi:hypothetical protein